MSKMISNHIICMVAVFCLQYSIGVGTKDSEHSEHQVYERLLASERKYVSLFHPLSLLRREVSSSVYPLLWGPVFTCTLKSNYCSAVHCSFILTSLCFSSQLLQLISSLHNWRNIPLPSDFELDDQTKRNQDSTLDSAFQTFCNSCNLRLPLDETAYGQLEKLIGGVWDKPIKTFFLSRYIMEVTGIMRQTVENALTSVSQVNLLSLDLSAGITDYIA